MTAPETHEVTGLPALRQQPIPTTAVGAWDPFQMMDRMDEEALNKELEGRVADELVYVIKDGGQEVVGLSKAGVDECCMALVSQGEVIREEGIEHTERGEGLDAEVLFRCKASRYAVSPDGREVRLDSVIGVKRQPLYRDAATITLDSKVPGKRYRGKTYRDLLGDDGGRDYLGWMADNFKEAAVRDFVQRVLNGEDPSAVGDRPLNPHWYEHGAMKAARNARFRLIPGKVRATVIAMARRTGRTREAEMPREQPQQKPVDKAQSDLDRSGSRPLPGAAGKWGGYAGKPLREVPRTMLERVGEWALDLRIKASDEKRSDDVLRFDGLLLDIELVKAARADGRLAEPPHKDGSTDGAPAAEREPGEE